MRDLYEEEGISFPKGSPAEFLKLNGFQPICAIPEALSHFKKGKYWNYAIIEGNDIIYTGYTSDIGRRLKEHSGKIISYKGGEIGLRLVLIKGHDSSDESKQIAMRVESYMIKMFQPVLNVMGK